MEFNSLKIVWNTELSWMRVLLILMHVLNLDSGLQLVTAAVLCILYSWLGDIHRWLLIKLVFIIHAGANRSPEWSMLS
jgi:Na+/H+ antiporter NhaC